MNGKGRKLFRSAVGILTSVMMMGAYTTTAMASGIGVIDAKDMLDIHAEANTASAVIGQVMEDGHVAILAKYNDWVQIQAGEIAGWVPAENLVETEISNEEAVAANEQVIAERTGKQHPKMNSLQRKKYSRMKQQLYRQRRVKQHRMR